MQYCSLQHQILLLSPVTSHIHHWVLFLLWLHPFILSGVISPLISSSILHTYRPGEFIFWCPVFLPFHTVYGVLTGRMLEWFVSPSSSGPRFVITLHYDPWVALYSIVHSFIDLHKPLYHNKVVIYEGKFHLHHSILSLPQPCKAGRQLST